MSSSRQLLGTWDQAAPRSWIRQVYCFQLQQWSHDTLEAMQQSLIVALERAAQQFPDFAARIALSKDQLGRLEIYTSPDNRISLKVLDDRTSFDWDYAELKSAGFPAKAFVGPSFDLPHQLNMDGGLGVPVTEIHARLIKGGLLLCIYIHHSVTDGIGMTKFITALAAHTRGLSLRCVGDAVSPAKRRVDLDADLGSAFMQKFTYDELIQKCPEFYTLPLPTGPHAIRSSAANPPFDSVPKTGRIFVFSQEKIKMMKDAARMLIGEKSTLGTGANYPSTFACLAALTWAYTTTVRLEVSSMGDIGHGMEQSSGNGLRICRILLPASWARRVSADLARGYSGNAVGMVEVKCDAESLAKATYSSPKSVMTEGKALSVLVDSIQRALASLDGDFVATRTAMMRAAADPRLIGVNLDPQDPHDFIVNS